MSLTHSCTKACLTMVMLFLFIVVSNVYASQPGIARIAKRKAELEAIQSALDLYKLDTGAYPSVAQGLQSLVEKPDGSSQPLNWRDGGYLGRLPKDPWGRPYLYRNPGQIDPVEVYSFGRDGKPGGCGENADAYSSTFIGVDADACRLQEKRRTMFIRLIVAVSLIIVGLLLFYLGRKLYRSVDGDFYRFISIISIWLCALILLVFLLLSFLIRIY